MTGFRVALHGLAVMIGAVHAQAPASGPSPALPPHRAGAAGTPAFDAVSIRPNMSGELRRAFRIEPGGNVTATNVTVRHLMWNAYGVQDFQIVGGPAWTVTDRYDILARAGEEPAPEQLRPMLRNLLADRFKLKVQSAKRDMPIYALVVARPDAKAGPKLRPADGACAAEGAGPAPGCGSTVGDGTLRTQGISMARLAGELTGFVGRRVEDRTGLTGNFAIELDWSPDLQADAGQAVQRAADARPSIFTALQEQLGLRLEPRTGPVEVIVIESVERP
jgi:uncharacterized protein (TIGR03435 family)